MARKEQTRKFNASHVRPAMICPPKANLVAQDSATTNTTAVGTNATCKFYQPFLVGYHLDAELASTVINTNIFTVPTGFILTVRDFWLTALSAEGSATYTLRNNAVAIATAITSANSGETARMEAGYNSTAAVLTAGQNLNVLQAGGTNSPAVNIYALCTMESV